MLNARFILRRNVPAVVVAAIVMAGGAQLMVRSAMSTATAQERKGDDAPTPVSHKGRPPSGDQEKAAAARPESSEPADPTVAKELARFEGTWVLVSSERDGRTKSEETNPYTVDVTGTPRKFDLIKPPRLGPNASADYGIYEWKDDTLRYCTRNGPLGAGIGVPDLRPRDFTTRDGDGRTVYLWKRAQPPAKAPAEPPDWRVPRGGLSPSQPPPPQPLARPICVRGGSLVLGPSSWATA
jgi:hypothetical protein